MKDWLKGAADIRMLPILVVALVILGVVIWFYPAQAPVIGRKAGMTMLGLWVGYMAYLSGWKREQEDDVKELMRAKLAMMLGVAFCFAVAA